MIKDFDNWLNESYEFRTLYDTYNEAMGDHLCKKFFIDHGYSDHNIYVLTDKDVTKRGSIDDDTTKRYLNLFNSITKTAKVSSTKTFYENARMGKKTEITFNFYTEPLKYVHCFFPQNEKAGYWYMFPMEELNKSLKTLTTSVDFGI